MPELDQYLQKQAGQDERRRVAACYLLLEQSTGEIVGYYTMIVDAKGDDAVAFYEHHGFTPFESVPRVLFLPIATALRRLTQ